MEQVLSNMTKDDLDLDLESGQGQASISQARLLFRKQQDVKRSQSSIHTRAATYLD